MNTSLFRQASFLRRVMAQLVDSIILMVVNGLVQGGFFSIANWVLNRVQGLDYEATERFAGPVADIAGGLTFATLAFIYYVYFHFERQATLGKQLMHIRVVDTLGGKPTLPATVKRTIWSAISYLPLNLGYWMALFRKDGATLHELMSDTRTEYRL